MCIRDSRDSVPEQGVQHAVRGSRFARERRRIPHLGDNLIVAEDLAFQPRRDRKQVARRIPSRAGNAQRTVRRRVKARRARQPVSYTHLDCPGP